MPDVRAAHRVPLLAAGFASLAVGIGAGLVRLGWRFPLPSPAVAAAHGALMVGFFGTVIALERAVALGARWAYAGPLAAGLGGVLLIAGAPIAAQGLFAFASAVMLAASIVAFSKQRALFTFTLVAGATSWLGGNLLWLSGAAVQTTVPWWLGFLVLTIAGERLELSRLLRPPRTATWTFAFVLSLLLGGIVASSVFSRGGVVGFAVGLVALSVWLARHDIARRTIRERGLPRFVAVCLLAGYAWLAVGGSILVSSGGLAPGSLGYDAALHAVALGFVFSMVLGHAPIIVPAVVRVRVPYHPTFYLPLALLHVSLLVRVAGDATATHAWRSAGGVLNAIAIAAFVVSTVLAVARSKVRLRAWHALGAFGVLFGLVTLKEGGAVLFVDGEARHAAGHYVPFVVWLNFLAGFFYVAAGVGLVMTRRWAVWLAGGIAAVTALGFAAFGAHVLGGGAFEVRTVVAMSIRTLFWMLVAAVGTRVSAHFAGGRSTVSIT